MKKIEYKNHTKIKLKYLVLKTTYNEINTAKKLTYFA